jgi:hypothetical protein
VNGVMCAEHASSSFVTSICASSPGVAHDVSQYRHVDRSCAECEIRAVWATMDRAGVVGDGRDRFPEAWDNARQDRESWPGPRPERCCLMRSQC